jgi:hypothetical protein
MTVKSGMKHATETSNLADVLERVLDKGVVIAGDIKVKLVEVELLTIQIRLVICSVDKAMEMGMNWWQQDSAFFGLVEQRSLKNLDERLDKLETHVVNMHGKSTSIEK